MPMSMVKPAMIYELRTNIEREIAAVSADLCLKIVKNLVQRLQFCKRDRGPCKSALIEEVLIKV